MDSVEQSMEPEPRALQDVLEHVSAESNRIRMAMVYDSVAGFILTQPLLFRVG